MYIRAELANNNENIKSKKVLTWKVGALLKQSWFVNKKKKEKSAFVVTRRDITVSIRAKGFKSAYLYILSVKWIISLEIARAYRHRAQQREYKERIKREKRRKVTSTCYTRTIAHHRELYAQILHCPFFLSLLNRAL